MVGVLTFPGGFMLFTHAFSCFTLLGSVNMNTVLPGCAKAEFFLAAIGKYNHKLSPSSHPFCCVQVVWGFTMACFPQGRLLSLDTCKL